MTQATNEQSPLLGDSSLGKGPRVYSRAAEDVEETEADNMISSYEASSGLKQPSTEPPDGGFGAWSQVFLVHLIVMVTWGSNTSFGIFQTYYTEHYGVSMSSASLVGGLQTTLSMVVGLLSGRAADAGYFKTCLVLGMIFQVSAMALLSFSNEFWAVIVLHGFLFGIGGGIIFTPALAHVSSYFTTKRSVALCTANLGSSTGGILFPILIRRLLPAIGFSWMLRVLALIMLQCYVIAIIYSKPRVRNPNNGPIIDFTVLRNLPFALYMTGSFFTYWPAYFAFYYIVQYAEIVVGLGKAESVNLILALVIGGLPFRVLPGYVADKKTGPLNLLVPVAFMASLSVLAWSVIVSRVGIYMFAVFYGCLAASLQALFTPGMLSLYQDPKKAGTVIGMGNFIVSWAMLTGPSLAGSLIDAEKASFIYAQLWASIAMALGGIFILAARVSKTGFEFKIRA